MIRKLLKISLIAIITFSTNLFAKQLTLEQFFDKYSDIDGVTYVAVNPGPTLMSGIAENIDDKNVSNLIKGINKIRILTTKKNKSGNNINIYSDAIKSLSLNKFQTFLEVKDKNSNVKMLYIPMKNKKQIKNFLMLVKEKDESTIIWIDGIVNFKDISKLTGMLGGGVGNKVKIPTKGDAPIEPK